MIVRAWSGRATRASAAEYLRHVTEDVFPSLRQLDGYLGARVLQRDVGDRVEFVVLTQWRSMESIRAFAGDDLETAVVHATARAALVDFDEHVRHFELAYEEPSLRR
jgi:heme-degrading monooxygenase HmoA